MSPKVMALVTSWLVTTVLVGGAIAGGGVLWGKRMGENARRGWVLVPALVTTRDLPAGAVLLPSDVVESPVPEQIFTDSVIRPGMLAIGRAPLQVPLAAGDLLLHSHFTPRAVEDCARGARKLAEGQGSAEQPDVAAFLEALAKEASHAQ